MTYFILSLVISIAHAKPVDCSVYKKWQSAGINPTALSQAVYFYNQNHEKYKFKDDYILLVDYSLNSAQKRFYILNIKSGEVENYRVSHGSGKVTLYREAKTLDEMMYVERLNGEKAHNGDFYSCRIADEDLKRINENRAKFNRYSLHNQTNLTRAGFFKTAELYVSTANKKEAKPKGRHHWFDFKDSFNGIRLDGLSPGVNDEARAHGVVMHEATYNIPTAQIMGRSYGCPAFEKGFLKDKYKKIYDGRLFFSYVPQCKEDAKLVEAQVVGHQGLCKASE